MLQAIGIILGLAVALLGAASAGLSFERKGIIPFALSCATAIAGWAAAAATALM